MTAATGPAAAAGGRRRNVAASLAGRAWGVLSAYLFLPFYLHFLGVESYGVVGFYAVLLGVMAVADLGLTATLNREMPRLTAAGAGPDELRDTARTIESVYWLASLALGAAVVAAAPWLAGHWLGARRLPVEELQSAVRLMGLALAFQLPTSLYQGGLLGLERQVTANALQVAWGVLRGVGSVLVLWLVAPTLPVFFWWNVGANAAYVLASRTALWRALPRAPSPPRFRFGILRGVSRYAGGMALMALLSAALIQMDKLVVSRMLALEVFGFYAIAWSLSQGAMILASPVAISMFPRLTALVETRQAEGLRRTYHLACQLAAVLALPVGLTLAVFTREVLLVWTGSPAVAAGAWEVGALLTVGSMALAVQVVPYHLALAHGWLRLNLALVALSLVLAVPLLVLLVGARGAAGAALAWLLLNAVGTGPYVVLLHRRLLPGETRRWLVSDLLRPLAAAAACVAVARVLYPAEASRPLGAALLGVTVVAAMAAAVLSSPDVLRYLRSGPPAAEGS